ncbi:hypothetical protein [Streptomyces sp. B8F3]
MQLADRTLATHPDSLLEPWLRQAARWGDENAMRQDAARFISV